MNFIFTVFYVNSLPCRTLVGAVEHLPRSRQIQLLGVLRNLEDRLRLSTAKTLEKMNLGEHNNIPEDMSTNIIPVKENKRITNAQVAQLLRRVGKAMTTDLFKSLNYNLNCRENKDNIGIAGIREKFMSLLNIRLSDRDVTVLMTRFDRLEDDTVDLVDILGNAKLYYARSVQEQAILQESVKLKAKNDANAKARRLAHMEDKAVINKMLSGKILELETDSHILDAIIDDGSLEDYSFVQRESRSDLGDVEMDHDLEAIRSAAYTALKSQKIRYLDALASKVNIDQFVEVLCTLGINSKSIITMLKQRFATEREGVVDAKAFKAMFKALAQDEVYKRKQEKAVSSFYEALGGAIDSKDGKVPIAESKKQSIKLDKEAMRRRGVLYSELEQTNSKLELIGLNLENVKPQSNEMLSKHEKYEQIRNDAKAAAVLKLQTQLSEQVLLKEADHDVDCDSYEDSFEDYPEEGLCESKHNEVLNK